MHVRRSFSTMLAAALLIGVASAGVAQPTGTNRNALTFGAGGGGLLGVTYERTIWSTDALALRANVSAGILFLGAGFPHGFTASVGGTHALELGVLGTYVIVKPISLGILGPANDDIATAYRVRPLVGYRRQPPDGGMVVRLYFSPYIHNDSSITDSDNTAEVTVVPWGGLMFGFAF